MKEWEFLHIEEITVKFKDKIFNLTKAPSGTLSPFVAMLKRIALRNVSYITNMPVFSNIVDAYGICLEYKTQTPERVIGVESIFYMN